MPNQGYVLGPDEGEHLIRSAAQAAPQGEAPARAGGGSIFIKVDPRRGSADVSLGTQHLPAATGIRIHRHFDSDEVLVGSSRVDLQACKLEYSIVSPK